MLDEINLKEFNKLSDSLPYFGARCLKIRDKAGNTVPLALNDAQLALHEKLEAQRREKGWVRALILKGRQPGVSTYVAARFYHRTAMRKGMNTYILSHEQMASDNLFSIVDRYQRNNPIAPHVGTSNIKEMIFDRLDSSYVVATAGTKAGGRSRSISMFHGSEAAFWANAADHFAASVQGVPLAADTEVIIETTSNGVGGVFYEKWQQAEAGLGDYIAVFLPWWWTKEYSRDPGLGFELSSEADDGTMSEQEYADTFKLSLAQMAWRRGKIMELGDPLLFRREYPADASDAWTPPAGMEPFIAPMLILRARKREGIEGVGPLILGVDPAGMGGDRFSIAARRGMKVLWVQHRKKIDSLEGTAWIRSLIDDLKPVRVCIDAGNEGASIVTNLKSLGGKYVEIVRGVNFGGTAEIKMAKPKVPGPANRRAEMWARMREWLMLPEGASIPDDPELQTDIAAPRLEPRLNHDFILEPKVKMKARGARSPDLADAVALTFSFREHFTHYSEAAKVPQFGNPDAAPVAQTHYHLPTGPTAWMS